MSDKAERIGNKFQELVSDGILSGVSWSLIAGDQRQYFYHGRQGAVSPFSQRELCPGMYYDLASLSKVIGTTTRIIQLLEQGRIQLDTEVSKLLEAFVWPGIRIGHLLLHNSGLPAEIRDKERWSREHLAELLFATGPERTPGEQFVYSDVGYILLGKIIEAVDKETLEESFREHIFEPLGMRHTSYSRQGEQSEYVPTECTPERGCICGEVHDKKAYLLGMCGSAGLFSTLEDVSAFTAAYLVHHQELFGETWFQRIENTDVLGRTYGWSREYGPQTLYHTGFTGTSILMNQEQQSGLIVLTNRIHPTRENPAYLEARKEVNRMFLD